MERLKALIDRPLQTLQLCIEATPKGSICWLTLNRPRALNAISMELLAELHEVLDALEHPNTMLTSIASLPRVLVLCGAGKAFCAGVDIKAADRGLGGQAWEYRDVRSQQLLARAIAKLRAIPQPVIAAVNGAASGGGCALAAAADVRVAARGASFAASFVRIGLTGADMGTSFFLPRHLPLGVAAQMMLTGEPLPAERAHALGLVNELVESADALPAAAGALARRMLALSTKGLPLGKAALNAAADGQSLGGALAAENAAQMLLVNDPASAQIAQKWLDAIVGGGGGPRQSKL